MGGLKPGARSALAKSATAAVGRGRSNEAGVNRVLEDTKATAEQAWQWEQDGHEKVPLSIPAVSSPGDGLAAW